jgi:predicted transcriptional regulator
MVTKERLHQLVDALPVKERDTAARVLEALAGLEPGIPFFTAETAPADDEPETAEEQALVAEGEADLAAGRVVAATDLYRRYGL